MAQYVEVVAYRPEWRAVYEKERERIAAILGRNLLEIHHIGSTSVPGLWAKPIIDIMPVVERIGGVDRYNHGFETIGYECMGEFGIPGRRYFRKGGEKRTHQIHIFERGNRRDIIRHLAVRDYLRAHSDEQAAYGALKRELAERYPYDIAAYCDGKEAFVQTLEQRALDWYHACRAV